MNNNQDGQQGPIAKGWWPDPRTPQDLERYFDGSSWTAQTRDPRARATSFAPAESDPAPVTLPPKAPEMAPTADGTIPMFAPAKRKPAKKKAEKPAPPRKNEAPPPPKQAPPLFAGDWSGPAEVIPAEGEKGAEAPAEQPAPPAFSPPPNAPAAAPPPPAPAAAPPAPSEAPPPPAPIAPPAPAGVPPVPAKGFGVGNPSDPPTAPFPAMSASAPALDTPPAPPAPGGAAKPAAKRAMPTTREQQEEKAKPRPTYSWMSRLRLDEEESLWLGVIVVSLIAVASGLFLSPLPPKATAPAGEPAPVEVAEVGTCDGFIGMLHPGPVTPELYDALVVATQQPETPAGLQEAAAAAVSMNSTDPLRGYCGIQ